MRLAWVKRCGRLTQKIAVCCMYFNTAKAALSQYTGTIYKLGDDMIDIRIRYSFRGSKNDIPDHVCNQPISDIERHLTWCNGFPKKTPFTCTPRGLAARVADLSNRGRAMLLACTCILLPSIQCLALFPILTGSQITVASQMTNIHLYISFSHHQIECENLLAGITQHFHTCEKGTPSVLCPFTVDPKDPYPW